MSQIGRVRAVFTASANGLISGVNSASSSLNRLTRTVSGLRSGMGALVAIQGAQLFGSMASTAGSYVRSLVGVGQAQADVIDKQSKLAARLGMTYGEFAGLALAGDLAGVSMETIAKAATKADIAFVKAQQGSKVAQAAFGSLGLAVDDLAGMSAAERFEAITTAIAGLPTEAQRAAAATALFGKAGAELLPLFSGGAEGIQEARVQAERLGLALTTAQGQDVEAMNDAFTMASQAIKGVVAQVVAYLSPAFKSAADMFTNLVGSVGGATIGQWIGDGILAGARYLAGVADWFIGNTSNVFAFASQVWEQGVFMADMIGRGAAFLSGVFNSAVVAFNSVVLLFSGTFEVLLGVAGAIAEALGFDTTTLDSWSAAANAFNDELQIGAKKAADQAAANFQAAFGAGNNGERAGQAIAGPITTALNDAVAWAEDSANAVEEAGRGAATLIEDAGGAVQQQLKGVDSRSSEGVAEMFRLMRGGSEDIQDKQLHVMEQIRDELAGGDDSYPFAFEGG